MLVRPIRIGVAGLGFGAAIHVPAYCSMPGVEVVAVMALHRDKAMVVKRTYGVSGVYTDLMEFLDSGLDAVSIALPPRGNAVAALAAINRGIPVLCEKPLADTADQAALLAQSANKRGVVNAVDFQFMELKPFIVLRHFVVRKAFGVVISAKIIWRVHSYAHRYGKWSWKTDADQGGGVLVLLGSHLFHLIERIFGPISRLTATMDSSETRKFAPSGALAADDCVEMELLLRSGMRIDVVLANGSAEPPLHTWKINGTAGSAILNNTTAEYMSGFSLRTTIGDRTRILDLFDEAETGDSRLRPFVTLASRFVAAVRGGDAEVHPNFTDGARVQQLIAMARLSNEGRTPVDVI